MIPQLKSIFNKNQWVQIQNWVNSKLTLKQDKFNASNTATGTISVTINAESGVARFTQTISGNSIINFSITSSYFSKNKIVTCEMFYSYVDGTGQGLPIKACIDNEEDSNTFYITVYNNSKDSTDLPIKISFQILN